MHNRFLHKIVCVLMAVTVSLSEPITALASSAESEEVTNDEISVLDVETEMPMDEESVIAEDYLNVEDNVITEDTISDRDNTAFADEESYTLQEEFTDNKASLIPDGAVAEGEIYDMGDSLNGQIYRWKASDGEHVGLYIYGESGYSIKKTISSINGLKDYQNSITDVVIEDHISEIGNSVFSGCTTIRNITMPQRLRKIGESAFYNCSSLSGVTLSDSLTTISAYAFSGCKSLTSITIPKNVISMGTDIFANCTDLAQVTFADGMLEIPSNAFCVNTYRGTGYVREVNVPSTVTMIGERAFDNQPELVSVNLNKSKIRSIGEYAFRGCKNLQAFDLVDGITTIGAGAFQDCRSLTIVTIPKTVTKMGRGIFTDCTSLKKVVFAEGIENIPAYALYTEHADTASIEEVIIPSSAKAIGEKAFYYQASLETLNLKESNITEIYSQAFARCKKLSSIGFPSSLTLIGGEAFFGCTGLESVTIPKNVTEMGSNIFANCTSLKEVSFAEGMTKIPQNALSVYKGLIGNGYVEVVNIPSTVTVIEEDAFYDQDHLKTVNYNNCKLTRIEEGAFRGCNEMQNTYLPDSLVYIGKYAFGECAQIKEIIIPKAISYIGPYAFEDCNSLYKVTFAEGIAIIPNNSLLVIDGYVRTVVIPSSVTAIGTSAFKGQSRLENVVYNGCKITKIGSQAFSGCSNLQDIELQDCLISIGEEAFRSCISLTKVTIPKNVKEIGDDVFTGCTALREVAFAEGMTTIPAGALYVFTVMGRGYVKTIRIPSTVTKISKDAFDGQNVIETVYFSGTEADKEKIEIAEGNDSLTKAEWIYTPLPNDWGDVPAELRSLFGNSSDNLPSDIWYAFYEDEKAEYFLASDKTDISKTYTGAAIELTGLYVFDGNKKLNKADYEVTYKNNTDAASKDAINAPEVTIAGKRSFTNTASFKFTIDPKSLKEAQISSQKTVYVLAADKKALADIKPTVSTNGKNLTINADYSLIYKEGTNVIEGNTILDQEGKTYTIAIEGKNNYKDISDDTVSVVVSKSATDEDPNLKGSMKNVKIAGFKTSVSYTGSNITLADLYNANDKNCKNAGWNSVTLYVVNSKTKVKTPLVEGRDYTVNIGNRSSVGKVPVTFTGIGSFKGTIKKTVTIKAANVAKDFQVTIANATYSKAGVMPEVTVIYAGRNLVAGTDYTVTYKNNKKPAFSTDKKAPYVIVKAKGNYAGTSKKEYFTINKGNVSDLKIKANDVKFKLKGKTGYFLVKPSFTDNGKKVTVGKNKDINATYAYTYAEKTTLKDGTERNIGDIVNPKDVLAKPTSITVTANVVVDSAKSSYEGSVQLSYTYHVDNK